jgi:ABC-type transport system involved in multi-copper enzyme maturation permease subunit
MRGLLTLTRMALRELWISFRLIPLVGVPVLGGMLVSAIPPEFAGETAVGGAGFWYGVGAAVGICVASGLAALTMSLERRRGTAAWMAVRAVPRSSVLASWFLAFALLVCLGLALGSVGAWLAAIGRAETSPDALPFAAAVGATAGTALAAVAAGLLIGTTLPTLPATLLAVALTAPLVVAVFLAPLSALPLPIGGLGLLTHLDSAARPVAGALQSAGAALAAAAVLLVLGGAGLERSDL